MQNNGWIKNYRKSLDNPVITKDSDHFAIWNYLLLKATHTEIDMLFKGKRITLKPGQLITGRKVIADLFKINEHKVDRILKLFETEQQIEQQTSSKNRLLSIINWEEYQENEQQDKQQMSNKRATSEQQVSTNKNERKKEGKNVKNNKNTDPDNFEEKPKASISILDDSEFRSRLQERFPDAPVSLEIRTMQDWLKANGRRYKDYEAFAKNWLRKKWKEKLPEKLAVPITTQFDIDFMNAKNDFSKFYFEQNKDRLEGNILKATGEVLMHVQKLGREQWFELYKQTKRLGIHFYKFITYKIMQENMTYNQAVKAWDMQQ